MKKNYLLKSLAVIAGLASASLSAQSTELVTIDFETANGTGINNNTGYKTEIISKTPFNDETIAYRVFDIISNQTDNEIDFSGNASSYLSISRVTGNENSGGNKPSDGQYKTLKIVLPTDQISSLTLESIKLAIDRNTGTNLETWDNNGDGLDEVQVSYYMDSNTTNKIPWFRIIADNINVGNYFDEKVGVDFNLDNNIDTDGLGNKIYVSNNFETFSPQNQGDTLIDVACSKQVTIEFKFIGFYVSNENLFIDDIVIKKNIPAIFNDTTGDHNWTNALNWSDNKVPTATDDVLIPAGKFVNASGSSPNFKSLTLKDDAQLAASSNLSITYCKSINDKNWHLISSPTSKTNDIPDFMSNVNNILAEGSTNNGITNLGLATYNTDNTTAPSGNNSVLGSWNYFTTSTTSGDFSSGKGYAVKLKDDGQTPATLLLPRAKFTGNIQLNQVEVTLQKQTAAPNNAYNLVGNPYTMDLSALNFFNTNTNVIKNYYWVLNNGVYEGKAPGTTTIEPGTGFMVEAKTDGVKAIFDLPTAPPQQPLVPKTVSPAELKLYVDNGNGKRNATVYFINGKTKGFDNMYEAPLFNGVSENLAIYTELVENNKGEKLQVQTLPTEGLDNEAIAVGIISEAGKTLTFSAEGLNLPTDFDIVLEDRVNNKFTQLTKESYKVTLANKTNGTGQFFIHTTNKSLSIDDANNVSENVAIFSSAKSELTISGLQSSSTNVEVYSVLGNRVFSTTISGSNANVSLPNLASGVYVVKVNSEQGTTSKKVILE